MRKGRYADESGQKIGVREENLVHNRVEMEKGKPIPRTAVYRCIVTCHLGCGRWAGKSGR